MLGSKVGGDGSMNEALQELLQNHAPNCGRQMGLVCSCGTDEVVEEALRTDPPPCQLDFLTPQEMEVLQQEAIRRLSGTAA